jgi:hypothetical protein
VAEGVHMVVELDQGIVYPLSPLIWCRRMKVLTSCTTEVIAKSQSV